jgi:hypothetical protein
MTTENRFARPVLNAGTLQQKRIQRLTLVRLVRAPFTARHGPSQISGKTTKANGSVSEALFAKLAGRNPDTNHSTSQALLGCSTDSFKEEEGGCPGMECTGVVLSAVFMVKSEPNEILL